VTTKKLDTQSVQQKLAELPNWELRDEKLYRQFSFENFVEAFGFMTKAALLAEAMNHHPEWSNVYNRVEVYLTTHDANGISEKDFELARLMSKLAGDA
jgi:4a-hydroxytetrahydrobiopterin dehydratase